MNDLVTNPTPHHLLEIAVNQGADVDKLAKLMELQERWEANEAKKAYVAAMAKFRSMCPAIDKINSVEYGKTKFSHATLASAIGQIKDLLQECELSHSFETGQEGGNVSVTCKITHSQGHTETTTLVAPADASGGKNNIQAVGSTVTYLQRYTLFAILGLATKDQDDDGAESEIERISDEQIATIEALIDEVGADKSKFLKFFGARSIDRIQTCVFDECIRMLEAKRK